MMIKFRSGLNINIFEPNDYFDYSLKQVNQIWTPDPVTGEPKRSKTKTKLELEPCGENVKFNDQQKLKDVGINTAMCVKGRDFKIAGTFSSKVFQYIEFHVTRCSGKPTCKSAAEVDAIASECDLNLYTINTYFDSDDYKNTIKYFLDDSMYWSLFKGIRKKNDVFIMNNQAELQDDLVQIYAAKVVQYFQVARYREMQEAFDEVWDKRYLSIYIRLDNHVTNVSRTVYSVADMMGQVGGVYEILFLFGSLIVLLFADKLFFSSIMQKIYQIQDKFTHM